MRHEKRNLMLIHGAWSSRQSFNHIIRSLDNHDIGEIITFGYDPLKDNIQTIYDNARQELARQPNTLVVGHSLGGLFALAISDHENCYRVITLASPLMGIKIPRLFQIFLYARSPILSEIAPCSKFISYIHKKEYKIPINCLITTRGYNPLIMEKSDGVVTLASQETWLPQSAVATYVDCNHYEILQSDQALTTIKKTLINQ